MAFCPHCEEWTDLQLGWDNYGKDVVCPLCAENCTVAGDEAYTEYDYWMEFWLEKPYEP